MTMGATQYTEPSIRLPTYVAKHPKRAKIQTTRRRKPEVILRPILLKGANYTEYYMDKLTQDNIKIILVTRLFQFIFTAASSDCEMATVAET